LEDGEWKTGLYGKEKQQDHEGVERRIRIKCITGLRHGPFYTCQLGAPCIPNNAAHVLRLVMTIINYIREG
jgi:hypothetical protein